jgi:hypothetical protein
LLGMGVGSVVAPSLAASARDRHLCGFADADGYLSPIADTAGPIALALQDLAEDDRAAIRSDVEDSLGRFAVDDGYELPYVARCAAAN